MSEKTIIENRCATLWFDADKKIVHHAFHTFTYGDAFQEILETGAELMEKHRAQKWLSDDRGNGALPAGDADWAQTIWFPRVMRAGWKYWALVQPEKVVGQLNMKRFVAAYAEQGLTVRVFTQPEAALEWLQSQ